MHMKTAMSCLLPIIIIQLQLVGNRESCYQHCTLNYLYRLEGNEHDANNQNNNAEAVTSTVLDM